MTPSAYRLSWSRRFGSFRVFHDELGTESDPYMRRWIFRTPLGDLRIHNILRSDRDLELHDHPFSFISFVLFGGYTEHLLRDPARPDSGTVAWWRSPGSLLRRSATCLHRLTLDAPAWTLVLAGRKTREWGFLTDRGWVHWKEFTGVIPSAPSAPE